MAGPGYFTACEDLAREHRRGGVLTVRFPTGGGPVTGADLAARAS